MSEKEFVDQNEIFVEVDTDASGPIVAEFGEYRGKSNFGVRSWYQRKDGKFARTRNGVSVAAEDAVALIQALIDAYNQSVPEGAEVDLFMATGEEL